MNRKPQDLFAVMRYLCVLLLSAFCCTLAGCLTSSNEPEKPAIKVDASLLDFGEVEEALFFNIIFTDGKKDWEISDDGLPSWCSVSVERKTDGAQVTVVVNRASLSPGEYTAAITVRWDSGYHTVKIQAIVPKKDSKTGIIIIDTPLPVEEEI